MSTRRLTIALGVVSAVVALTGCAGPGREDVGGREQVGGLNGRPRPKLTQDSACSTFTSTEPYTREEIGYVAGLERSVKVVEAFCKSHPAQPVRVAYCAAIDSLTHHPSLRETAELRERYPWCF